MGGANLSDSGIDNSLYPWEAPPEQLTALVVALHCVLRVLQGPIIVQLVEAQLGVHLEDSALPVRLHILVHFSETREETPTDRAQMASVGFCSFFIASAIQNLAGGR